MSLSVDREASLLSIVRRLWMGRLIRPLVMIALIFAANISHGIPKTVSIVKTQAEAPMAKQSITSPLPSRHTPTDLHRRWLTEATVISHSLTSAHFSNRRVAQKLLAKKQDLAQQG